MINNDVQLNLMLTNALKKAVDSTTEALLKELVRIIDETVYSNSPTWYERTNQFRQSWESSKAKIIGISVESEIYQNISALVYNATEFKHGNIFTPLFSNGNALADILNQGTNNASFGFHPVEATDFWEKFMEYADANLDRIFSISCMENGIQINTGISIVR